MCVFAVLKSLFSLLVLQPFKKTVQRLEGKIIWRSLNNSYLPWPTLAHPVAKERETEVSESALPYSKGFMNFGCLEPKKLMFDFGNIL